MRLIVGPAGQVQCVYDEAIDLGALGSLTVARASHVEPDGRGRWRADLGPVAGPVLGPFPRRSLALQAERAWLEENWLTPPAATATPANPSRHGRTERPDDFDPPALDPDLDRSGRQEVPTSTRTSAESSWPPAGLAP